MAKQVKRILNMDSYRFLFRKYVLSRKYNNNCHFGSNIQGSNITLEIIIPCIDKDKTTIKYCIDSLKKNLKHPISSINIICPHDQDNIEKIAKDKGCNVIYEDTVVPIKKEDINYVTKEGKNRSGRLYQQLIKLYYSYKTDSEYYYVIDSDTMLVSNQVFEDNGKIIYLFSDEGHKPYYDNYERLLGEKRTAPMSFVAHQMVFNKKIVDELIKKIEGIHNKDFISALMDSIDTDESSGFSEFELYGNYMYKYHRGEIIVEYRNNKGHVGGDNEIIIQEYEKSGKYRSVSFHHYL